MDGEMRGDLSGGCANACVRGGGGKEVLKEEVYVERGGRIRKQRSGYDII